ncbi:MAG: hypothetical protein ACXQS8_10085 [Candidatus Helarchaeales archaeon]
MNQSYIIVLGIHGLVYLLMIFFTITGLYPPVILLFVFIFDLIILGINYSITVLMTDFDNEGNTHPLGFYISYLACIFPLIYSLLNQAFSFFKNDPLTFTIIEPLILFLLPAFLICIMPLINYNCIEWDWDDIFDFDEYPASFITALIVYQIVALALFWMDNFVEFCSLVLLQLGFPFAFIIHSNFVLMHVEASRILLIPSIFMMILGFSYGFAVGVED